MDVTKYFRQLLGHIFQATFRGQYSVQYQKPNPFPGKNTEELLQTFIRPSKSTYSSFISCPSEFPRTEGSRARVGKGKKMPIFFSQLESWKSKTSRKQPLRPAPVTSSHGEIKKALRKTIQTCPRCSQGQAPCLARERKGRQQARPRATLLCLAKP